MAAFPSLGLRSSNLVALVVTAAAIWAAVAQRAPARGVRGSSDNEAATWTIAVVTLVLFLCLLGGLFAMMFAFVVGVAQDGRSNEAPAEVLRASDAFEVSLDRSAGGALGVGIDTKSDHLLITRVEEEGLAADWNKAHPDAQVRVGDKIIGVNGWWFSGDALMNQCNSHAALSMKVLTGLPPPSQILKAAEEEQAVITLETLEVSLDRSARGALGVGIDPKSDHLLIKDVEEEGLVADWNKAHPDAQVRVGDKIVGVNGVRGSGDAILSQCQSHAALSMRVLQALPPPPQNLQGALEERAAIMEA